VAIAVVVIAIVGAAIIIPRLSGNDPTPGPNPAAALPVGVLDSTNEYAYGKVLNPETTNKPVLAIWEDFQCPACAFVEKNNGLGIQKLAAAGKIQLIWRPTTFLDRKLKTDASQRATAAWGCAIDANKIGSSPISPPRKATVGRTSSCCSTARMWASRAIFTPLLTPV
jgi:hypothetical protein